MDDRRSLIGDFRKRENFDSEDRDFLDLGIFIPGDSGYLKSGDFYHEDWGFLNLGIFIPGLGICIPGDGRFLKILIF